MARRIGACALLGAALLGALTSGAPSCVAPTEISVCGAGGSLEISGMITRGKATDTVTAPYTIQGSLTSDTAIDSLTVGGVPATTLAGINFAQWSAQLQAADLEQNRMGDFALIDVVATDVCGVTRTIDSTSLPLGPDPLQSLTNLRLEITIPMNECYLPADGSASATVKVLADATFAGAPVTLAASQGTFSAPGTPPTVTLAPDGADASYTVFYTPAKAGSATLSASGQGATSAATKLAVAAAPLISSPPAPIARGTAYALYVTSTGNLSDCRAQASDPAQITVTIVDPPLGVLTGVTSVETAPQDCRTLEQLRVDVLFDMEALDGAQVTLLCRDTFGQEGSSTVTVAPLVLDGGP